MTNELVAICCYYYICVRASGIVSVQGYIIVSTVVSFSFIYNLFNKSLTINIWKDADGVVYLFCQSVEGG